MSTDKVKNLKLASSHKARYWQAILYEDSAPENWRQTLDDMNVMWCASPIHDLDKKDDGELKKAHYHVYLIFDNAYTYNYANGIFNQIDAVFPDLASVVIIKNLPKAIKYLTHEGKPDKAQYDKSAITHSEDFVIEKYADIPTEKELREKDRRILLEILDYINENDVTELIDLTNYCRYNNLDWLDYISHKTVFINFNITSKRNKKKEKAQTDESEPDFT